MNPLLSRSGKGRTQLILQGAEPLDVMETLGFVLQALENTTAWAVLRLDEETTCHVRPSAVLALVDIGHGEHEAPARNLRPLPAA